MKGLHKSVCLNGRGTPASVEVFDLDEAYSYTDPRTLIFHSGLMKRALNTFISGDAINYSYVQKTGKGKPFINKSSVFRLGSFFSKYAQTSLSTNYAYYRKHCKWYYLHFAFSFHMLKMIY